MDDHAPAFVKSSYSSAEGANCVEVAEVTTGRAVRDSKLGAASPILRLPRDQWSAFIEDLKL